MGNSVVGLAGDQVLAIAQADAARVYRDLSLYRIQLVLEDDGWHVDYELKNPRLKGGGPHYIGGPWAGSLQGLLPGAPTDPGVHVKCTRFVTLWNRCPSHDWVVSR